MPFIYVKPFNWNRRLGVVVCGVWGVGFKTQIYSHNFKLSADTTAACARESCNPCCYPPLPPTPTPYPISTYLLLLHIYTLFLTCTTITVYDGIEESHTHTHTQNGMKNQNSKRVFENEERLSKLHCFLHQLPTVTNCSGFILKGKRVI